MAPVDKTEAAVDGEIRSAIGLYDSPLPHVCPALSSCGRAISLGTSLIRARRHSELGDGRQSSRMQAVTSMGKYVCLQVAPVAEHTFTTKWCQLTQLIFRRPLNMRNIIVKVSHVLADEEILVDFATPVSDDKNCSCSDDKSCSVFNPPSDWPENTPSRSND